MKGNKIKHLETQITKLGEYRVRDEKIITVTPNWMKNTGKKPENHDMHHM